MRGWSQRNKSKRQRPVLHPLVVSASQANEHRGRRERWGYVDTSPLDECDDCHTRMGSPDTVMPMNYDGEWVCVRCGENDPREMLVLCGHRDPDNEPRIWCIACLTNVAKKDLPGTVEKHA